MAKDVSAFLTWTAEPHLESRNRTGIATLLFLLIATILAYFSYKQIWLSAKRPVRPSGPMESESVAQTARLRGEEGIQG
jgi:ubiquinol-cytochrome c reductase cytochrome c1 subunit